MLRQLLFVAALALALACVGCDARATFADKIVESVQQQRLAVFYPLGARFELVASSALAGNDTDNPTSTDLGWEGWLALSIVTLVFVVTGLVFCFMGYKLFKLIVALIGFIGGFILGVLLTLTVAGWAIDVPFSEGGSDWQIAEWVALGVGILFGVILALCSWWFYMVGIFLVGGGVGLVLAFYIYVVGYTHLTDPSWLAETLGWITAVVLFIVLGFLAMKLQKFMIILGSAAIGGFLVLLGPYTMIAVAVDLTKYQWVDWLFVVGLAFFWVAGVLVQYRFTALEDWHEETYNIERRSFV